LQARVLLVSSEAVPLVKTGGLADVITALAVALHRLGVDVNVLMPAYPAAIAAASNLEMLALPTALPGGPAQLLRTRIPGTDVTALLLDSERFRQRCANPYVDHQGQEFADNAICFADLAHAAVAIAAGETSVPAPHVVHANDWHAGLIPFLLRARGLAHIGSMLTIHNLAFQGNYPRELAGAMGIPAHLQTADGLEFWGQISYLKAGIHYADCISTVSQTYASEILTPRFGCGMEGVLAARSAQLQAIPNGIDTELWDPATDPLIARPFSTGNLRGKGNCKRELQALFGLLPVDPFAPVMGIGSRMSHQKMADVALQALPGILDQHERLQLVVLGCGEHAYEQGFLELAQRYPGRVGVHIGYDEQRAHALHAGCDMLLHGTRFEPFGLTPLYAMRYGTIPIGSRVGGLNDTICDAGTDAVIAAGASGVLFDGDTAADMTAAVARAFRLHANAEVWQQLQANAMQADFSWAGPARQYLAAYAAIADDAVRPLFLNPQQPVIEPAYKIA